MSRSREVVDPVVVMHDPRLNDPAQEIVCLSGLSEEAIGSVLQVFDAMRRWREVEQRSSEASRRHMKLGASDMRALRMLIAAQHQNIAVTPSAMAAHLGISTASTTKMLDRLERGGHITRLPHPDDRRSLVIEVTEQSSLEARTTVGREHSRRFDVVARMPEEHRRIVTEFFHAMAATAERDAV